MLHCLHTTPTGWMYWLLAQSPTHALQACTLHGMSECPAAWHRVWAHVEACPSMVSAVQRALMHASNTMVADEGAPQGPAFLAGPTAGARLLTHTLPLALLAPAHTLEHLVRMAVNGQHGSLVAALLADLTPLWGSVGQPPGEAVLHAVEGAVRSCCAVGCGSDAAEHSVMAFLRRCMEVRGTLRTLRI